MPRGPNRHFGTPIRNVAYCASKCGLRGLSDALREDLRDQGIRVSTVYPGQIDTTIWDSDPWQLGSGRHGQAG